MTGLLLRDAELDGRARADVRVSGGRIVEIGRLARAPGERVLECRGGALLPGLCDHHIHLHALAAWRGSVHCGHPVELADALRTAIPDEHGWIRGVGYAGDLDAAALDALEPHRPVRIQHRSGALWMLNSAALAAARIAEADHAGIERDRDGRPTGRLWRADGWLRTRLPAGRPDLAGVGRELARLGITAVTDATPDLDPAALDGFGKDVPQRLHLLGVPLDATPPPGTAAGPYKIVIADSGLPGLDELAGRIRAAHSRRRPVAVHCVTREALLLLLAAIREVGAMPGDRVEHAALVPPETLPELAALGLRVVTQPGFIADRGDGYLRDVPAADLPDLYRCASLASAGIPLALSSDAPYGPLDPWRVMEAAVRRRTASGAVHGEAERLSPLAALRSYLTPPGDPGGAVRHVRPGADADLVLLDVPLAPALERLHAGHVRSVLIDGRLVWDARQT